MQKAFNEFLGNFETINDDEIIEYDVTEQIEEKHDVHDRISKISSNVIKIAKEPNVTRKLVVMLDRLDENVIERYKNKTTQPSNEQNTKQTKTREKKSTKLPPNEAIKCHICGYKPNFKENLIRHIALKHTFEKSQCEICKKVFDNKTKMEIHSRRNHEVCPEFKCQFCDVKYNVYIKLHKHVKNHHPFHKFKIQCFCDICGEELFSKTRLESHMKDTHFGPFKCFDVKCIKSFTTAATRKKHYLALHSSDHEHFERLVRAEGNLRPFKCLNGFCNKRFKGYDAMLLHYRRKGKNLIPGPGKPCMEDKLPSLKFLKNKPFSCDLCDYKTSTRLLMFHHIKHVHIAAKVKCTECNKTFKNLKGLKLHQHRHLVNLNTTYSDKFGCLVCNKSFRRYQGLQTHVESFHSLELTKITHTCDLCDTEYYSIIQIRSHMTIQHVGPYGCFENNCTRRFSDPRTRNRHSKTTHGRNADDLKRLMKTERNFFPYKCLNSSCEKRFKEKYDMLQHHRTHQ